MPVLFNKASGAAENLDPQAAQQALATGTHEVPVVDSSGQMGSTGMQDAASAVQAGTHRQPTPEELQGALDKTKYEAPVEQAKTFGEGALNGATFGLANDAEALALGNSDEQLKRRNINPGVHQLGQASGLLASSLYGVGEGAALEAIGSALVPKATTALGRIGTAATKSAIENMVFQSGDDASKAFMGDPEMTSAHYIDDMKMSAVLGAAIGGGLKGTGELWAATAGKKLGNIIDAVKARTEPTLGQRFEAVGQDATNAGAAANVEATNGVGRAVTDSANLGADNLQTTGNAIVDAQNRTTEAVNNLASGQNQTLSLADRLTLGNKQSEAASLDALKMVGEKAPELPVPLLQQAGLSAEDVPATLRNVLGDDESLRMKHSLMQSGSSSSAQEVIRDVDAFKTKLQDNATRAVGYTPEDMTHLHDVSENAAGRDAATHLRNSFSDIIETGSEGFDKFHEVAKSVPLDTEAQLSLSNRLVQASQDEGWAKSPSSPEAQLLKRVLTELPLQENASDLAKYTTIINNETERAEMWRAGTVLRKVFREEADNAIERHLAEGGGKEIVAEFQGVRKQYGALIDFLEENGKRLGVNSFNGPKEFMSKLNDIAKNPEKLLAKLSAEGDENLSKMLSEQMPDVYKIVNDYNKADLVKKSLTADRKGIDVLKLGKNVDKLSPEFRARVLPNGGAEQIKATESLQRAIPERFNKSGTGGYLMNAISQMSASGVGMAATMAGGPIAGAAAFVLKKMGDYVGKEVPDAITLSTLKTLTSEMGTNPSAFKDMARVAAAVIRGETVLNKAVKAVFSAGTKVISEPSPSDLKKLSQHVDTATNSPEKLLDVGGHVGHYMPEAGTAIATTSARVVQYLASLRPHTEPLGPLDNARQPSAAETAAYDRALRIAEKPSIILNDIKAGKVSPHDIKHLMAMYPAMHSSISSKLLNQVMDVKTNGKTIPYATKLGLSAFMGQPLEASMRQMSIASTQATFGNQAPHAGPSMPGAKPPRSNPKMITVADAYQTPTQSRAAGRHGRP